MDGCADGTDRPRNRLALVDVVTGLHQAVGRCANVLQQGQYQVFRNSGGRDRCCRRSLLITIKLEAAMKSVEAFMAWRGSIAGG